jgi:hypothetical protein
LYNVSLPQDYVRFFNINLLSQLFVEPMQSLVNTVGTVLY